jgi:hypothetical protein
VKLPNIPVSELASMLAALGASPVQKQMDGCIRIEAGVPRAISEASLIDLYRLLRQADAHFGHAFQRDGTSVIWAEIDVSDTQDIQGES